MSDLKLCDICGKPIGKYADCKNYKVKKRVFHYGLYVPSFYRYTKIDVHTSCLSLLIKAKDKCIDNFISTEEINMTVVDNMCDN